MANVWPATQSQLYGELNKLASGGLIEVSDIGPRGRKEYRVTDAGREDLLRWMTNPQDNPPAAAPTAAGVPAQRDETEQARAYVGVGGRARRRRAHPRL